MGRTSQWEPRPDALAPIYARLAYLEGRERRRRIPRRLLPLALAALLVTLLPLSLLAATPFTDLTGGPHDGNIDAIFNAGITKGCDPPTYVTYCPTANVTREEMASFLARTAGLGGNAPVANAKTSQTAASATTAGHATSADTATNAANATDATTVGGLAPNSLVRVARGTGSPLSPFLPYLTGTYSTVVAVTITVPGPGFVLVSGNATYERLATGSTPGSAVLTYRLHDAGPGGTASIESYTGFSPVGTTNGAASYVFPVGAAGGRTFVYEASSSYPNIKAYQGELTALFIPFGATGGATLAEEGSPAAP